MWSGSPLVSVVIPTYDRPTMLREATESVDRQTHPNIELIVVDDASPAPAEATLADLDIEVDVRIERHDENRGANAARNTGIEAATGDIITFLDDDDRWVPWKLERQVEAFDTVRPTPGVVLVGQRFVDDGGETIGRKDPEIDGAATAALFSGNVAGPFSSMAIRQDVIEPAGLPDAGLPSLQDREWLIRLSHHTRFHSIREPLVIRRMGSHDQIGDRFVERRDVTYHRMLEKHRDAAASYGRAGSFHAGLALGVAASALRAGAYREARRFALRAIRADPTSLRAYGYALAAMGGGLTYRPARSIKHHARRLVVE